MRFLKAMTAGLMLAALPLASHAEDMSYSFVDLGWIQTDIDGFGPKADGFALRGSVGFAENFFAFAEYADQSISIFGVGVDIEQYAVGLGGHYGLSDNLDIVAAPAGSRPKAAAVDLASAMTVTWSPQDCAAGSAKTSNSKAA